MGWTPKDAAPWIGSVDPRGQPNAPVPLDRPSPYAPSAAPSAARPRPWRAALAGFLVGLVLAVAVGAILLATKAAHLGSATDAPRRVIATPVSLPNSLPGFPDFLAVNKTAIAASPMSADKKAAQLGRQEANQLKVEQLTVASYQRANPGAAVAFRGYANSDLEHFVNVIAVRAAYPGLTLGPVPDPAYLGLAVPQQQVKSFGQVDCLVTQSRTTLAGQPVDPENDVTIMCQRTGEALSVQLYGGGGFTGVADRQTMVALTNSAWNAASG